MKEFIKIQEKLNNLEKGDAREFVTLDKLKNKDSDTRSKIKELEKTVPVKQFNEARQKLYKLRNQYDVKNFLELNQNLKGDIKGFIELRDELKNLDVEYNVLKEKAISSYKVATYLGYGPGRQKLIEINNITNYKIRYTNINSDLTDKLTELGETDESYELNFSDLVAIDLDSEKAPLEILWGGDQYENQDKNIIYGPLFDSPNVENYQQTIMAIDLAQQGTHETAYCVAKNYKDHYFIAEVGGLGGGYINIKENRLPTNLYILEEIERVVNKHKVKHIIIESNIDLGYVKELENHLLQRNMLVKVTGQHQSRENEDNKGKRRRIINILKPLLEDHELVIDTDTLMKDILSNTGNDRNNLHYKFAYQFKNIQFPSETKKRKKDSSDNATVNIKTSIIDREKNLQYDDRIDAVAQAIRYLSADKKKQTNKNSNKSKVPGMDYSQGRTVKKNIQKAYEDLTEYIKKPKDSDLLLVSKGLLGRLMIKTDLSKGKKLLKESAHYKTKGSKDVKRYVLAEYTLGNIYQMDKNTDKAFKYYKKAARNENHKYYGDGARYKAMYKLATTFKDSLEEKKQLNLLQSSADAGYTLAQLELGKMHENKQDFKQAIQYYKQAAELSNLYSLYNVDGNSFIPSKRAVERSLEAFYRLGGIYYKYSEYQNYFEAIRNFLTFLESGNKRSDNSYEMANYKLGNVYFYGKGIKAKDLNLALYYYKQAGNLNSKNSKIQDRIKYIENKNNKRKIDK